MLSVILIYFPSSWYRVKFVVNGLTQWELQSMQVANVQDAASYCLENCSRILVRLRIKLRAGPLFLLAFFFHQKIQWNVFFPPSLGEQVRTLVDELLENSLNNSLVSERLIDIVTSLLPRQLSMLRSEMFLKIHNDFNNYEQFSPVTAIQVSREKVLNWLCSVGEVLTLFKCHFSGFPICRCANIC